MALFAAHRGGKGGHKNLFDINRLPNIVSKFQSNTKKMVKIGNEKAMLCQECSLKKPHELLDSRDVANIVSGNIKALPDHASHQNMCRGCGEILKNISFDDDDPKAESDDDTIPEKREKIQIIGDAKIVTRAFARLKISELCTAYIGLLGLGISIVEREVRYGYGKKSNDTFRIVLLSINLLFTILLCISIYFSYRMILNWKKAQGFLNEVDDLINTGIYKYFLIEAFICCLSPLPFIYNETFNEEVTNQGVTIAHFYNDVLLALCFSRIYLLVR